MMLYAFLLVAEIISTTSQNMSSFRLNNEELVKAEKIAEFTYENQKIERGRIQKLNNALSLFGANW